MSRDEFAGRVALVTGATSGIGKATAEALVAEGASVALVARHPGPLEETRDALRLLGPGRVDVFPADVSLTDDISMLVPKVIKRLGKVDYLINSAGIMGPMPGASSHVDASDWDGVFAVNVRAPFLLAQGLIPQWRDRGEGGAVVNVGSSAAHRTQAPVAYSSSKAALEGFTRTLAGELASLNMTVNLVAPGLTETTRTLDIFENSAAIHEATVSGPLANLFNRASRPSDIADMIVFLCSPRSRQVTGQVIHVSAGNVVQ